uniref:Uncharacterized protein n=1 Tax=Utricularia reniformis TaxID=192314 RepID=A0A1Y0B4F9_9LAMI|nr:hypothetical protein AEK19_MT2122 [Utricularia reniformis]ART32274.1 hypothetical protein AEK19_MT2122 [Utricularia reniformis]
MQSLATNLQRRGRLALSSITVTSLKGKDFLLFHFYFPNKEASSFPVVKESVTLAKSYSKKSFPNPTLIVVARKYFTIKM